MGRGMAKFLAATAALAFFVAINPAFAAGVNAPLLDPVWNWTGFYVGGNFGYSWGRSNSTLALADATTGAVLDSRFSTFALDGILGGGQIGYNWQLSNFVFGLEGDFQGTGQQGSTSFVCPGGTGLPPLPAGYSGTCSKGNPDPTILGAPVTDTLSERLDWFSTIRGRLGYAITPRVMIYGTGGLAFGDIDATNTVSGANLVGTAPSITSVPISATSSIDVLKAGWTVGAGLEAEIWGNWTGKIEYLHIDLGNVSGSFGTPLIAPSGNFLTESFSSRVTDDILRIGVNYRFF